MDTHIPHEPPAAGTEFDTLMGSIERQRRTFAWKCDGLDAAGQHRVGASTMTLGGLLKHLAWVEDDYGHRRVLKGELDTVWKDADFGANPDWEWATSANDSPGELHALWEAAVSRSRAAFAEAYALGGLDRPAAFSWADGKSPSLRRLAVDLIEEYARHTGHADLLREAVDGRVGEDAPDSW